MEKETNNTSISKEFTKKSKRYTFLTFIILLIIGLPIIIFTVDEDASSNSKNIVFTFIGWILFSLILSYFVGIFIASILFLVKKYNNIINSSKVNIEDSGIVQRRSLTLPYDYEMAFYLCMESVSFLKHAYVKKADINEGIIKVRVGMSWRSLGESITFSIKPLNSENAPQTLIKIESKPIIPGALYDYGKNKENVQTITHFLNVINKIYINLPK